MSKQQEAEFMSDAMQSARPRVTEQMNDTPLLDIDCLQCHVSEEHSHLGSKYDVYTF